MPALLDAMAALPREMFVEKSRQGIAYVDEDLEVAPGRYLMEPVVLARMVQALELARRLRSCCRPGIQV